MLTKHWSRAIQHLMTAQPTRTLITSHPTNDDRSSDHEPSYTWWPLNQPVPDNDYEPSYFWWPLHWSRAFQCTPNTWWLLNLPSNGHHYRSATIYKHTLIKINFIINNNNYLIIQPKTRLHTPSRAITSLLTARAPSKPSHSRSTQPSHSRSTQLSRSTSTKPSHSRSTIQAFSQ